VPSSPVADSLDNLEDLRTETEYRKIVNRKVSINEQNVIGTNFERYNREEKPSVEVRRKIANFVSEFTDTKDREHAKESLDEVCQETGIARFTFVGYVLHNAFSFDQTGWQEF
jgi:phosphoribulokinase